ncbi:MAG: S-methyl-5-thioribose-1-phosphate isomerase [Phycisphaeraceae bacterium]|nr:S-methyl-5-thioribose-1-phosphate isomerase [Phycisphaeraceae bacterium]
MFNLRNIEWVGPPESGCLRLLDQTRLPTEIVYLSCRQVPEVFDAIRRLSVRGAPAIGVAAAYACVLAVQPAGDRRAALTQAATFLASSRPTAVNLFWALDRMQRVADPSPSALLAEAKAIHDEDQRMCQQIGRHGLELFRTLATRPQQGRRPLGILTHCNAGALATGGIGTATAPMYLAHQEGLQIAVLADETRPLLQGARLTAFELQSAGVDVTLICDNMAAQFMRQGVIDLVITGADRIAANGDAANKIGTYGLAVLARHHGLPFFVAAPSSTFDLAIPDGRCIPIEQRHALEITEGFGKRTAPADVKTANPAFDVTPHELISAIITEKGVIQPVDTATVARVVAHA